MYFKSFEDFIHMGGHGFYVWLCYGVVLFSLIIYYFYSKGLSKKFQSELVKFYQRLDSRAKANSTPQNENAFAENDAGTKADKEQ